MLDWVERIFDVAPDGGSGALEVLYVAAGVAAVAAAVAGMLLHRRRAASARDR